MFSILDIDNVHGDWERNFNPSPSIPITHVRLTPAEACAAANDYGIGQSQIVAIRLRERMGRPIYEMYDTEDVLLGAVDAELGEVILRIPEEQAKKIALSDFRPAATVASGMHCANAQS